MSVEDLTPEPRLDDILDSLIFRHLGEFGFSRNKRSKGTEFWRCESSALDLPVRVSFDKGSYSQTLTGMLEVEKVYHFADIGYPFFFRQLRFPFCLSARVEEILEGFFCQYARVFPHVWSALAQGIEAGRAAGRSAREVGNP
jgi:hypothetical protein